ncbi:DUF3465 domain-containing protein [Vibrio sp. 10N.261.46.E11]
MCSFNGYPCMEKTGGVMHWTHKDSRSHHAHDWLKHNGKIYE